MNNDFEENDYGFDNFDDSMENGLNTDELVDVRIILTSLDHLEFLSKAVSNFDLSNFNVNISSIIPTKDIEIAKNTVIGADLVLIATENNAEGNRLYQSFKKSLRNEFNYIEYLKLPSLDELNGYEYGDYSDENIIEDEIANSIIRPLILVKSIALGMFQRKAVAHILIVKITAIHATVATTSAEGLPGITKAEMT